MNICESLYASQKAGIKATNDGPEFYWRDPGWGGSPCYLSEIERDVHGEVTCGDKHGIDNSRQYSVGGCQEYFKSSFCRTGENDKRESMFSENDPGTAWSWWVYNCNGNQGGGVELTIDDARRAVECRLREMLRDGLLNRDEFDPWKH